MAEDNRFSVRPAQGVRRRTLSDSRSIRRPMFPAVATGPTRARSIPLEPQIPSLIDSRISYPYRASQAAFFEASRNVRISGGNFNPGHHTVGDGNIVVHMYGSNSGIQLGALGLLRPNRLRPFRLSRSNPTSGANSPTMLPQSTNDSAKSTGVQVQTNGQTLKFPYQEEERGPENENTTTIQVNEPFETYYRHLIIKQRGFPLWIPEPHDTLPVQYQRRGVGIGDVGILTDCGGFEYLFNICMAKDDPINPVSILDNFRPLDPSDFDPKDIRECSLFRSNDYLASSVVNTKSSPLTFVSTESEGAILVLPNGSNSYDLLNVTAFMKYASINVKTWYKYAKETFGYPAMNGDLRLVVGHDNATSWGSMSFSHLHELESFRFRFKQNAEHRSDKVYNWEYLDERASAQSGPDVHEIETLRGSSETDGSSGVLENQCLFLRTLNITFHHEVWRTLVAEGIGEEISTRLQSFGKHPSKAINGLLLKMKPDAKFAITQDLDWISVLETNDELFPSPEILFGRILEKYNICEDNDAVFLKAKPIEKNVLFPDESPQTLLQIGTGEAVEIRQTNHFEENLEKSRLVHREGGKAAKTDSVRGLTSQTLELVDAKTENDMMAQPIIHQAELEEVEVNTRGSEGEIGTKAVIKVGLGVEEETGHERRRDWGGSMVERDVHASVSEEESSEEEDEEEEEEDDEDDDEDRQRETQDAQMYAIQVETSRLMAERMETEKKRKAYELEIQRLKEEERLEQEKIERHKEMRRKEEEMRRKEEEMVRKKEEMKRREEIKKLKEAEARREKEVARRLEEEERRRVEEVEKRKEEEETARKEEKRKRVQEDGIKRVQEIMRKKQEAKRLLEEDDRFKPEMPSMPLHASSSFVPSFEPNCDKSEPGQHSENSRKDGSQIRVNAAKAKPEMRAGPSNPSSSFVSSFKPGGDDFMPDQEWKDNLKKNIKDSSQAKVDAAMARQVAELEKNVVSPEDRIRLEKEYKEQMADIKWCAQETYDTELAKEINLRRLLAGAPLLSGWGEILSQQQRDIVNSIKQTGNPVNRDNSPRPRSFQ